MPASAPDFTWIPDHQFHVVLTLAHVDDLTERCWRALLPYQRDGLVTLADRTTGARTHVVVTGIAPLPGAVALYAADALTQMRAALEHTLYAEIQATIGRELTADEARAIEMPAHSDPEKLTAWFNHKHRRTIGPLQAGPLAARIRELQPFDRQDSAVHPLRLLAEHTNLAKHRMPAVAAVHMGHVQPHRDLPGVRFPDVAGRPVAVDDVLVDAPTGTRLELDVWPTVSIRRPHTGDWKVLMHELRDLSWWVRCVAVPTLVAGRHDVTPMPPQLDTFAGHHDVRDALAAAGTVPAAERSSRAIQDVIAREGLRDTLALHRSKPDRLTITAWIKTLTDEEVVERLGMMSPGHSREDILTTAAVVEALLIECATWAAGT